VPVTATPPQSNSSPQRAGATITTFVTDSRPLVRAGLVRLLSEGGPPGPLTEAGFDAAAETIEADRPDVLVIGLRDDDPQTFRVVAAAKTAHEELRVMVVADSVTVIDLREAVIAGVDSFLLSTSTGEELRDGVLRTANGERIVSPTIAMQLAGTWRNEPPDVNASALTPREIEVLQLLAEGLTNQQVGSRLGLIR
jgi:two-component system, NarL family, response regulator DevR